MGNPGFGSGTQPGTEAMPPPSQWRVAKIRGWTRRPGPEAGRPRRCRSGGCEKSGAGHQRSQPKAGRCRRPQSVGWRKSGAGPGTQPERRVTSSLSRRWMREIRGRTPGPSPKAGDSAVLGAAGSGNPGPDTTRPPVRKPNRGSCATSGANHCPSKQSVVEESPSRLTGPHPIPTENPDRACPRACRGRAHRTPRPVSPPRQPECSLTGFSALPGTRNPSPNPGPGEGRKLSWRTPAAGRRARPGAASP